MEVELGTLPPFNVHMVKGWTRCAALHLTLWLTRKQQCFDRWIDFLGSLRASSLATIHLNKYHIPDGIDQVDVNRGSFVKKNETQKNDNLHIDRGI